jgi:mannose-6-phosphate isomerase-like protein (cupin superfamily)
MSASPDKERIYCVLRGTMTVKDEHGTAYDMEEGDMIYIPPGEKRDIAVTGGVACRILVVMSPASPK